MRIKSIIIIVLVLSVLAIAIVLGFSYIQSLETRTNANDNASPNTVEIVNLTDSSTSIVWKTIDSTTGKINLYGADGNPVVVPDDRDTSVTADTNKRKIHIVTLNNLTSVTKYLFTILSNDKEYFNNTQKWDLTTLKTPSSALVPKPIYGQANVDTGSSEDIFVKLIARTANGDSLPLEVLSTKNGTYSFDLSSLRTSIGDVLYLSTNDQLIINMFDESNKQAQIIANIK